jgi:hypothetical protein
VHRANKHNYKSKQQTKTPIPKKEAPKTGGGPFYKHMFRNAITSLNLSFFLSSRADFLLIFFLAVFLFLSLLKLFTQHAYRQIMGVVLPASRVLSEPPDMTGYSA